MLWRHYGIDVDNLEIIEAQQDWVIRFSRQPGPTHLYVARSARLVHLIE